MRFCVGFAACAILLAVGGYVYVRDQMESVQ